MSNVEYAKEVVRFLDEIPQRLATEAIMGAIRGAMEATYQDSGNAAYQWYVTGMGGLRAQPFADLRGSHPVGVQGATRGAGDREVIDPKVGKAPYGPFRANESGSIGRAVFDALRNGKGQNKLRLAHPLPAGAYANHAKLGEALAMAEVRAKQAADTYMARFPKTYKDKGKSFDTAKGRVV